MMHYIGKVGFSDSGVPLLIGTTSEDLYEIKYIDAIGQYRNE